MLDNTTLDDLERDHGTAILSELTGQHLTRNQQPVRLFDQTRHGSEFYFRADEQGKPYVQNFQEGKRYYPVTAYYQIYNVDFTTAKSDLCRQYYGDAMPYKTARRPRRIIQPVQPPPVDYIPTDYYEPCRTQFNRNGLYEWLRFTYGTKPAEAAFDRYRLGTSRQWQYYGYLATCLPQFDIAQNLRQIKIIVFDAMNGRRVKKHQQAHQWNDTTRQYEPTATDSDKSRIVGRYLPYYNDSNRPNLQQCFFGEHLLPERHTTPVALVEGESTAIVCSIVFPQYVWLATGGSNGARWTDPETFSILNGRDVVLWPDNDAYADWLAKAKPLGKLVASLTVTPWVKKYVQEHALIGMEKADLRDLLTLPLYTPTDGSSLIFGEPLWIELPDHYPPDWDKPNIPGTMTTIREKMVREFLVA